MTESFTTLICNECNNEQRAFTKASTTIACLVCDATLAESTGSTITIKNATETEE